MEKYSLISNLKDYAEANSMVWIYGDNFHRNLEATKNKIGIDAFIFGADPFVASPRVTQYGKLESILYNGLIMLGRKFEQATKSTIDETYQQKYDNRLKELMQLLSARIISFSCDNGLTIVDPRFELSINSYDENIDFVICSVGFLDENLS